MKKLQAGLVIEGNLTASILLRLPAIAAELGPIKSSGLQVARRGSNFLRAGYAVNSYAELQSARIIFIRVPDTSVDRVAKEICESDLNLPDHSFVLCESWSPTEKLDSLRVRGANTASIVALPTNLEKTFAVEGDMVAVRLVRRLIERADGRTLELKKGAKHLLFAATLLCTAVPVPMLLMAQQALRDCGVSGNQLSSAIEEMNGEMIAGFLKGARTYWGGPLAESLKSFQGDYWGCLDQTHPELANTLREWVTLSRSYMSSKLSRSQGA
jgi:predicted short-subunit dehydrogenase-like oxidoreductase (DUF2520 family)